MFSPDLPPAFCSGSPGIVGIEGLGELDCESPADEEGMEGGRGIPLLDEGDDDGLVGKFILGIDVLGGVGMAEGGVGMGLGGELVGEGGIGRLLGDGVLGGEGLD